MKVAILINSDMGLYKFRRELIETLFERKVEVVLIGPKGEYAEKLSQMGCRQVDLELSRHGKNPFSELKLLRAYKKILKKEKPDFVLTYTIKPNIYGGMAARSLKIPFIANVTGLGDAIENGGLLQKITLFLYKKGLKGAKKVFFQNKANLDFFIRKKICKANYELLPGSGVNVKRFSYIEYPQNEQGRILFIGRITKDKGVFELASAIERINAKNKNIFFDIVGAVDGQINPFEGVTNCEYHGSQKDVRPFIKNASAVILPSYHEGMANVLLEAAACGRPVLASKIPGCQETFDEGETGYGFAPKSIDAICEAIDKFVSLSAGQKELMGIKARNKIEKEFNRQIVVDKYLEEMNLN